MPSRRGPRSQPQSHATSEDVRALLAFFERLETEPDALDTLPQAAGSEDSPDARLVEGVRRLAARVRELNDLYDLLMAGADDGLWDWDLRPDTVRFSRRW